MTKKKDERTNSNLQNTTQKYRATRTTLTTERVCRFRSTCDIRELEKDCRRNINNLKISSLHCLGNRRVTPKTVYIELNLPMQSPPLSSHLY